MGGLATAWSWGKLPLREQHFDDDPLPVPALRAACRGGSGGGRLGQGHVTVFLAFAVDVQQHPVAVDIGDLQMGAFQQPPAAGGLSSTRRCSGRANTARR